MFSKLSKSATNLTSKYKVIPEETELRRLVDATGEPSNKEQKRHKHINNRKTKSNEDTLSTSDDKTKIISENDNISKSQTLHEIQTQDEGPVIVRADFHNKVSITREKTSNETNSTVNNTCETTSIEACLSTTNKIYSVESIESSDSSSGEWNRPNATSGLTRNTGTQYSKRWNDVELQPKQITVIRRVHNSVLDMSSGKIQKGGKNIICSNNFSDDDKEIDRRAKERTKNKLQEFKELETGCSNQCQKDAKDLLRRQQGSGHSIVILEGDRDDCHIEAMKLLAYLFLKGGQRPSNDSNASSSSSLNSNEIDREEITDHSTSQSFVAAGAGVYTSTNTTDTVSSSTNVQTNSNETQVNNSNRKYEGLSLRDIDENEIFPRACILSDPKECSCIQSETTVIYIPEASGITQFDSNKFEDWISCIEQNINNPSVTIIMTLNSFKGEHVEKIRRVYKGDVKVINLALEKYRATESFMEDLLNRLIKKHEVNMSYREEKLIKNKKPQNLCKDDLTYIIQHSEKRGFVKKANDFFRGNIHKGKDYFCSAKVDTLEDIQQLTAKEKLTMFAVHSCKELKEDDIVNLDHNQNKPKRKWYSVAVGLDYSKLIDGNKSKMMISFALRHDIKNIAAAIRESLNGLERKYLLQKTKDVYSLSGKAVENSFLIYASKEYLFEVLASCDVDFLYKYVQISSKEKSELDVCIDRSDHKTLNYIIDRLKDEIMKRRVAMITNHTLMRQGWFVDIFLSHKSEKHKKRWTILKQKDAEEPYNLLTLGVKNGFIDHTEGSPCNIAEQIIKTDTWKKHRSNQEARVQESAALEHAAEFAKESTFVELVKTGVQITEQALKAAIKSSSCGIVLYIFARQRKDYFTYQFLCICLKLSLEIAATPKQTEAPMKTFEVLAERVDINYKTKDVQSLVHFAARNNNLIMLEIMNRVAIDNQRIDLDLDIVSADGETALTIAISEQYEGFALRLIELGATQRKRTRLKKLPITIAAETGQTRIVKALLDRFPDICQAKDEKSRQAIHLAVMKRHTTVVTVLAEHGKVRLDGVDDNGQTALHIAAEFGFDEIVEVLLEKDAKTDINDKKGNTPLSLAKKNQKLDTVKLLEDRS